MVRLRHRDARVPMRSRNSWAAAPFHWSQPRKLMARSLLVLCLVVLFAATETVGASAQGTATTLAELSGPTGVTALGGRVLWSTFDPSTNSYRLTQSYRGVTSDLPIAARAAAFDADLGTDARGRIVAVYSRCSSERGAWDPRTPRWDRARGCRIYEFDFAGHERRMSGLPGGSASEFLPTLWRGRLAYALVERPGGLPKVRLGKRELPGGRHRVCGRLQVGAKVVRSCVRLVAPQPSALDLGPGGLAIIWQHGGAVRSETPHLDVRPAWSLLVDGSDGSQREVNHANSGEANVRYLLGGSWDDGWLYSARACYDECAGGLGSSGLFRYRGGLRRPQSAPRNHPPSGGVDDVVVGGSTDREQRLLDRARRGDASAFDALVRSHQTLAFRTACVFSANPHDAEEATQDAFLKAWRALPRFRPRRAVPALAAGDRRQRGAVARALGRAPDAARGALGRAGAAARAGRARGGRARARAPVRARRRARRRCPTATARC